MYHGVVPGEDAAGLKIPHAIGKDVFAKHLEHLKRRFSILHPEEFADHLEDGRPFPRKTALVTVDDGFRNAVDHALPAARDLEVPLLLFTSTAHLDEGEWLWFSRLAALALKSPDAAGALRRRISGMPLKRIHEELDRAGAPRRSDGGPLEHLLFDGAGSDRLREAVGAGGLILGGHTVHHPNLPDENDDMRLEELARNREALERIGGRPVRMFAYPSGLLDESVALQVRDAGFSCAFSILPPVSSFPGRLHRFHIPRIGIYSSSRLVFRLKCLGIDSLRWRLGILG
jgi:peptidoglycan/xylan/chitin deacetylase (PgdA/CDA1 family)